MSATLTTFRLKQADKPLLISSLFVVAILVIGTAYTRRTIFCSSSRSALFSGSLQLA
jgi:hypothetical protein